MRNKFVQVVVFLALITTHASINYYVFQNKFPYIMITLVIFIFIYYVLGKYINKHLNDK